MRLLVDENGNVIASAEESITFGLFENDPNHKWALDGGKKGYVIDGNVMATDIADTVYKVYEVDAVPEDYWCGKLLFVDGEFVENPNWVEPPEPPKSNEERIAELEAQNAELQASIEMQAEVLDFLLMQ
jgi:hypothetical protein